MTQRNAHPYLMYESIFSVPDSLEACLAVPEINFLEKLVGKIISIQPEKVFFVGCGTSYNAGIGLAKVFEEIVGLPSVVVDSLEFYLHPPINLDDKGLVILISHSGNTLPTIQAAEKASSKGAFTISMSGFVNSGLPRVTSESIIDPSGAEVPRPKTRSYLTTYFQGILLASYWAKATGRPSEMDKLKELPHLAQVLLESIEKFTKIIAKECLKKSNHFLVAGARGGSANSVELSLKIMETLGLPATGFELEEFTHGPGYCLRDYSAVILFNESQEYLPRTLEASEAVLATDASAIVFTTFPNQKWNKKLEVIAIPDLSPILNPILSMLPAQLLVYYLAVLAGKNPDVACTDDPKINRLSNLMFPPGTH